MCSTSPPSRMHGVGFWASRRSGPKTLTYSPSTGSFRRSAGTSGNWARNSPTVIGVPADRAHAARSGEWRICMEAPSLLDEGEALERVVAASIEDHHVDPVLRLGHLLEQQLHVDGGDPGAGLVFDLGVDRDQ